MPTPPRETIGGTKGRQLNALDAGLEVYDRILQLEEVKNSSEWDDCDQDEKDLINDEIIAINAYYEANQARVATY